MNIFRGVSEIALKCRDGKKMFKKQPIKLRLHLFELPI